MNCAPQGGQGPTRRVAFGLVGASPRGQELSRILANSRRCRLAGIADVDLAAARDLARLRDCPFRGSVEALVRGGQVEVVVVSRAALVEPDLVVELLRRGVHVVWEAPLAAGPDFVGQAVATGRRANAVFLMAATPRYSPDLGRARRLAASGCLGQLLAAELTLSGPPQAEGHEARCGVLSDLGLVGGGLLGYLLDPVCQVQGAEGRLALNADAEETGWMWARTARGVSATVSLSWIQTRRAPLHLLLSGTAGSVEVGDGASSFRGADGGNLRFGSGYDAARAFGRLADNVAAWIAGDEPLRVGAGEALSTAQVVRAAQAALSQRLAVAVAPLRQDPAQVAAPVGLAATG